MEEKKNEKQKASFKTTFSRGDVLKLLELQKQACADKIDKEMTAYTVRKTILETKLINI